MSCITCGRRAADHLSDNLGHPYQEVYPDDDLKLDGGPRKKFPRVFNEPLSRTQTAVWRSGKEKVIIDNGDGTYELCARYGARIEDLERLYHVIGQLLTDKTQHPATTTEF